jgi:hypothetical protein
MEKPCNVSNEIPRMKIRKPVNELTVADFMKYPAWEYALDEEGEEDQDETTVRPYEYSGVLDPSAGSCMVRTKFILADGSEMTGFVTPREHGKDDPGDMHPVIITPRGSVGFWCGMRTIAETLAENYRLLGKSAQQVFPLKYKIEVKFIGGPTEGTIAGFFALEDIATMRYKLVT